MFAHTPPPSPAFPGFEAGRPPRPPFRGMLSVHSRHGPHARRVTMVTPCTNGSSGCVTSTAVSVATGTSEPIPGRDFHPLWTSAFSRRTRASGLSLGQLPSEGLVVVPLDLFLDGAQGMVPNDVVHKSWKQQPGTLPYNPTHEALAFLVVE